MPDTQGTLTDQSLIIAVARHGSEIESIKSQMAQQQAMLQQMQSNLTDLRVTVESQARQTMQAMSASMWKATALTLTFLTICTTILGFILAHQF